MQDSKTPLSQDPEINPNAGEVSKEAPPVKEEKSSKPSKGK